MKQPSRHGSRIERTLEEWDGGLDHVPPGLRLIPIQADIGDADTPEEG